MRLLKDENLHYAGAMHAGHEVHFDVGGLAGAGDEDELIVLIMWQFLE
jgi:hypothetical protein